MVRHSNEWTNLIKTCANSEFPLLTFLIYKIVATDVDTMVELVRLAASNGKLLKIGNKPQIFLSGRLRERYAFSTVTLIDNDNPAQRRITLTATVLFPKVCFFEHMADPRVLVLD